jgi:hypothetical protein
VLELGSVVGATEGAGSGGVKGSGSENSEGASLIDESGAAGAYEGLEDFVEEVSLVCSEGGETSELGSGAGSDFGSGDALAFGAGLV